MNKTILMVKPERWQIRKLSYGSFLKWPNWYHWKATLKLDYQAKRDVTSENTQMGNLGNQWQKAFFSCWGRWLVTPLLPLFHWCNDVHTLWRKCTVLTFNVTFSNKHPTSLYKSYLINYKPVNERVYFPQVWWRSSRWRHGASIGKVSQHKTWKLPPTDEQTEMYTDPERCMQRYI